MEDVNKEKNKRVEHAMRKLIKRFKRDTVKKRNKGTVSSVQLFFILIALLNGDLNLSKNEKKILKDLK